MPWKARSSKLALDMPKRLKKDLKLALDKLRKLSVILSRASNDAVKCPVWLSVISL
jgi:hypothetical protein